MTPTAAHFGTTTTVIDPRAPGLTLGHALAYFVRRPSVIGLLTLLVTALAARVWLGDFGPWDLLLAGALATVQPLSEWLIHVEILHFRPRRWLGRCIDLQVARDHRAHHADPHEPRLWFIPLRSGVTAFALIGALAFAALPAGLALSVIVAALALGTLYEWTHYLCHAAWRPRTRWFRTISRLHRLHHFKNEHYWMGVTSHAADRLLGTLPDPGAVETSPTCRNLHEV